MCLLYEPWRCHQHRDNPLQICLVKSFLSCQRMPSSTLENRKWWISLQASPSLVAGERNWLHLPLKSDRSIQSWQWQHLHLLMQFLFLLSNQHTGVSHPQNYRYTGETNQSCPTHDHQPIFQNLIGETLAPQSSCCLCMCVCMCVCVSVCVCVCV